jgi:PAS domain S-box-containing protein
MNNASFLHLPPAALVVCRQLFRASPFGMVQATAEGTIEDCNRAFSAMLGRDAAALVGTRLTELVVAGDRELVARLPESCLVRAVRIDGSVCWLSGGFAKLDGHGAPEGTFIGIFADVTEHESTVAELRDAERVEALGRLLVAAGHELSSPLQLIGNNLTFLDESSRRLATVLEVARAAAAGTPLEATLASLVPAPDLAYLLRELPLAVRESIKGTETASKIVHALKAFSPSAKAEPEAIVDLNAAVENVMLLGRSDVGRVANVLLDLGEVPMLTTRVSTLHELIANLLLYAKMAVEEARRGERDRGTITIRTWMEGPSAVIAIEDTGSGARERGAKQQRRPRLDVARVLAEELGGIMTVKTELGVCTKVYVRLPVSGSAEKKEEKR